MAIQDLDSQIASLSQKRAQLQGELEKVQKEELELKPRVEAEALSGESGTSSHDLRECQTRQEILQDSLSTVERQLGEVRRELAEQQRLEALKPMIELEQALWDRLAGLKDAIAGVEKANSELNTLAKGFRPATYEGQQLEQKIGLICPTTATGLRAAREAIDSLLNYRPKR